jgi:hypothetical protein
MKLRKVSFVSGLALLGTSYLRADFIATSQSATDNPASGLVTFSMTFNQTPDFFTIDNFGRAATDFQFDIIGDPTLGYPANFDSIIRGGEIYLGGGPCS